MSAERFGVLLLTKPTTTEWGETMAPPKGNQFWKARATHGRKRLFESRDALWEACCEYFQWVEDNPLWETKAFHYQGIVTQEQVPKMRPMTIGSLCIFLDINVDTWKQWRKVEDFSAICNAVDTIIREQKFAGAAADLLNHAIIARDLGLVDKSNHDHTSSDKSMTPTRIEIVAATDKNDDDS